MSLKVIEKRDYVKVKIPRTACDVIPIKAITPSGIAVHDGNRYSKMYEIEDIDFSNLDDLDKSDIFFKYSDILNSFAGTNAQYKISIFNRNKNKVTSARQRQLPYYEDGYDDIRKAYNDLRMADFRDATREHYKYITVTTTKSDLNKAASYYTRVDSDLPKRFSKLHSGITPLNADERIHVIYDFLNAGKETMYVPFMKQAAANADIKPYMVPDGLKYHSDYFEIGKKLGRVVTMREWSRNIKDEFIRDLSSLDANFFLTIDIIPLSSTETENLLEDKDSDVEASVINWSNTGNARNNRAARVPRKMNQNRKILDEYISDVTERNQKVFLAQLTMVILADSQDELNNLSDTIEEIAAEHTCRIGTAWFMQHEGLINALPFGIRTIQSLRDCTTETLAMLVPFNAKRLNHDTGIPYGKQKSTGQQVYVDRRLLLNGNEIILGVSGSGKSQNAKLKTIYEALVTNGMFIIVDPDGEYASLTEMLGGRRVQIGVEPINALEIIEGYGFDEDPKKLKSNFIITLFEQIIGDYSFFDERKKSIVDRCIKIMWDNKTNYNVPFDLTTLYYNINNQPEEEAKALALALERHILGNFNVFAREAKLDIGSYRFIDFDLSKLDKQLKNAGMLVCLDSINNILARNRYYKMPTYIKLDELNEYLKHKNSCMMVESFFQRARKYGGFVTGMIQDVEKLLDIPEARSMINNVVNIIMMKQSPIGAEMLAEMYNLSEQDEAFLRDCEPGFGINKIGKVIYQFDGTIPKNNLLYSYTNTDGHSKF